MRVQSVFLFILLISPFSATPEDAEFANSFAVDAPNPRAETPVEKCLRESRGSSKWVDVSYLSKSLCNSVPIFPDFTFETQVDYRVRRANNRIQINKKIFFNYKGSAENYAATMSRIRSMRTCAQDFFARQGLTLELEFQVGSGRSDSGNADQSIKLYDNLNYSNDANWSVFTNNGDPMTADEFCFLAIHEIGHGLGLPDRYVDPNCPDRNDFGSPGDAMAGGSPFLDPRTSFFQAADIQTIINPVCGGEQR